MATPDIFGAGSHLENDLLLVNCEWLEKLLSEKKIPLTSFPKHPNYSDDEIKAFLLDSKVPPNSTGVSYNWRLISTETYRIKNKFATPSFLCDKYELEKSDLNGDECFSEVLQYVEESNFIALWHEGFKKFNQCFKQRENCNSIDAWKLTFDNHCVQYPIAFAQLITQIYRCPIIVHTKKDVSQQNRCLHDYLSLSDNDFKQPNHINQVLIAILCDDEVILLKPFKEFNLKHALQFSPNFLGDTETRLKTLFILYQVIDAIKNLHAVGTYAGDFHLEDVNIDKNYLTSLSPNLEYSLIISSTSEKRGNVLKSKASGYFTGMSEAAEELIKSLEKVDSELEHDLSNKGSFLQTVVKMWIGGSITNFDYLMILNYLSGRKYDNPNYYPVLPWVQDFSCKNGGWRDFSKSKYRLNKGDQQLDLTYDGQKAVLAQKSNINEDDDFMVNQRSSIETPPHHISDVLSEITYYVYKARITSKDVLCRHVRNRWVPAEYPSTMQRLQAWTPDECIPDFFTDTSIFTSKHEDLNDLELPEWCNKNPEKFIDYHMATLESPYVSERLHHWIDLTFGYKLSGSSAIRAKNVCLHLVNRPKDLRNHGVVQLFCHPHPIRQTGPATYWNSNARRLLENINIQKMYSLNGFEDIYDDINNSVTSVYANQGQSRSSTSSDSGNQSKTKLIENNDADQTKRPIALPKDFDMNSAINELDNLNAFLSKCGEKISIEKEFKDNLDRNSEMLVSALSRRKQDIIILGIFILELYMPQKFSNIGSNASLNTRLNCAIRIIRNEPYNIPLPLRPAVMRILGVENVHETKSISPKILSEEGLPAVSAAQLLHPTLSPLSFPKSFQTFARILRLLEKIQLTQNYKSKPCTLSPETEQTVAEVKVKMVAAELSTIIDDLPGDQINLMLPVIKSLFQNSSTAILAVWFLFEPVSKALGPSQTCIHLLEHILNIYEQNSQTTKHLKLYHRTLLLNLLVRLGMKTFLKYFVTYIIEAVGGYKDFDDGICKEGLAKSWHTVRLSESSSVPASPERMNNSTTSTPAFEEKTFIIKNTEYTSPVEEQKTPGEEFTEGEIFDFDHTSTKEPSKEDENTETRLGHSRNPVSPQHIIVPSALDSFIDSVDTPDNVSYINKGKDTNISDIASESVLWLSHRLGPVLSAKYLSRNLLKMLNLCYNGPNCFSSCNDDFRDYKIRITRLLIKGDELAHNVLQSLSGIVALYGEQLILLQYLPYAWDLISLCRQKRGGKLTPNLEGGLLGCMALVHHMIPYLSSDSVLMNELSDGLLARVLFPVLQVATSRCLVFSGGWRPRNNLIYKLLDVVYIIGLRIGEEMARVHLTPICSALFAAFDKAFDPCGRPLQSQHGDQACAKLDDINSSSSDMLFELSQVLIPELAYDIYVTFYHLVGRAHLDSNVPNLDLIQLLCSSFKEKDAIRPVTFAHFRQVHVAHLTQESPISPVLAASSGSRGGNMVSIGSDASNIVNSQKTSISSIEGSARSAFLQSLILKEKSNPSRHLKGNWLAYWEHETGRPDTDQNFVLKQIPLQSFIGHTTGSGVKCLHILDNENSFLSGGGSRDRTVKVWSLRSQGDGATTVAPQWSYTSHKKSIQNISFLENLRWVVSCDSTVHIWDPFVGAGIHVVDSARLGLVSAMATHTASKSNFGPSLSCVWVATNDNMLHTIDCRTKCVAADFKVCVGSVGLIKSICALPEGNTIAIGHNTGFISQLDIRTGKLRQSWKGHEGEIITLSPLNNCEFLSSSLDQAVTVWSNPEGKFRCSFRIPIAQDTGPVHCTSIHGDEIIMGSTTNKIIIRKGPWNDQQKDSDLVSYNTQKLKSDIVKTNLTSMKLLPMNKLLLLGQDNGTIKLVC